MKKIELFINIVLYGVYSARMMLGRPFTFLHGLVYKLPCLRAKKYQDRYKMIKQIGNIVVGGYIIGDSRGLIIGGIGVFLSSFFTFLCQFVLPDIGQKKLVWLGFGLSTTVGLLVEYFFITKHRKYEKYFREFDKKSSRTKVMYGLIGVGFMLFCFGGFIFTLWLGWPKL